ncbi:DUF3159 domain-containing protein [Streptomyces candidus]|uniref:DUF3159 domain-containing protein n=1 Tax=Streptomyces candidus TaxID=67283 RepID=A0A7X0HD07_9ACTN|nr:hypothetical protein [Streptomyces candidus]GHH37188.1 membrane protein [Streptomyces candidus]
MTSFDKPTTTPHQGGDASLRDAAVESPLHGAPDSSQPYVVPRDAPPQDPAAKAATEAALFEAFGGVRGMAETVLPGLLFVTVFTINKDLHTSAIAALGVSLLMVVARLVRKDSMKHAFSGVFGVAFGVVFAMMTGNAKDFMLPGMLYTLGLSLAYLISAAAGVPLIGLMLGPVFKENLSWRTRNPGRKKAYTKASYAWGLILLTKCAILFPLYWWADTTKFGWVVVALKIPPFLLAVWLTWIFLAKAPAPIDVFAEMEAEEKAEKERKAATGVQRNEA